MTCAECHFRHDRRRFPAIYCALLFLISWLIISTDSFACRPKFINCPNSPIPVDHCWVASCDLDANAEGGENCELTYSILECSGRGSVIIDPVTGQLHYFPAYGEAGSIVSIIVDVCHEDKCAIEKCEVQFLLTNNPPLIDCGTQLHKIYAGYEFRKYIGIHDADRCDVSFTWVQSGPGEIDDNGVYVWTPNEGEVGRYKIQIATTDGYDSRSCSFIIEVINPQPYELQIENIVDVPAGDFVNVDVLINKGTEEMGGFDLLIGYNTDAMAFTEAAVGQVLVDCEWEYFTYRYNWNGNCGEDCPSGLLRLVAIAETNNGPIHPSYYIVDESEMPISLATLTFFTNGNIHSHQGFHPIRFYWMECGDNSMALRSGDTLAISRDVYDSYDHLITDPAEFPGWAGAPDTCLAGDKVRPVRFIDFKSGGIRIERDSIVLIGDININGVPYEIADWVLFKSYMLKGPEVFYEIATDPTDLMRMKDAADINHDGIRLQLEDLIYMYRIIIGDAEPCSAICVQDSIIVDFMWDGYSREVHVGSPDHELATAWLLFDGEITPELEIDTACFSLEYFHHAGQTAVLVHPECNPDQGGFNMCRLFRYEGYGILKKAHAADFYGNLIRVDFVLDTDDGDAQAIPGTYQLSQNYPNPFNPVTEISFNLPRSTSVSLEIFNALGERVANLISCQMAAGEHRIRWNGLGDDGNRAGSGVYFYRLETEDFTEARKMILLK